MLTTITETDYRVAIASIVVMSGITTKPEPMEIDLVVDFFQRFYKPRPHPSKANVTIYSPAYLTDIWRYGIAGKFPMPEHYNKLSLDYIGKVINEFKAWRQRENARPKAAQKELPQLPPKSTEATNKSICIKEFERFKEKGTVFLGSVCYDALVELDQFEADLYQDYLEKAETLERSERTERGKASGSLITMRSLVNAITPKTIDARAKTMAVEEYFRTIDTTDELGL